MAEVKDTPESKADQIGRVELMADGDIQWDMSDNDMAALNALLADRVVLLEAARESARWWSDMESALVLAEQKNATRVDVGDLITAVRVALTTNRAAIAKAEGR